MWKVSWRGLLAHKARFVLTALAVMLGVMFITATYVITDTTNAGFVKLFTTVNAGIDLQVRAVQPEGVESDGPGDARASIPAEVLDIVLAADGVDDAEGLLFRPGVAILGADGEVVQKIGRPVFATNFVDRLDLTPYRIVEGRAPEKPGEVLLDSNSVEDGKLEIGGPVDVILPTKAGRQTLTVVGVLGFGDEEGFAAAQVAMFETSQAQEFFDAEGKYDFVAVSTAPGFEPRTVLADLSLVLPLNVEVLTGEQVTDEQVAELGTFIGIFGNVLRGFGFVGMFVAAFIIVNTFTIVVSQRVRELALLRALGASPRQIVSAVLAESALIGTLASFAGLGLGYLLGIGIQRLLASIGFDPGGGDAVLDIRTVIVGFAIGTGVTMAAAVWPAIRAARTRPLAAVRDVEAVASVVNPSRTATGLLMLIGGVIALLYGAQSGTSEGLYLAGGGALGLLLGAVVLGPHLARPASVMLGGPVATVAGVNGRLARANVARNPRRTSITASALMIGLAIAMGVMVLTASVIRSIDSLIDKSIAGDLTISDDGPGGFTAAVRDELRTIPEVGAATSIRYGDRVVVEGKGTEITAIEVDAVDTLLLLDVADYSADVLAAPGGALISDTIAEERGWTVGQTLEGAFPSQPLATLTVAGTFSIQGFMNDVVVSIETYDSLFEDRSDFFVIANAAPGVGLDAVREAVDERIGDEFPNVNIKDRQELKAQQRQQAMLFLAVFVGLMLLTVFISILGILNTLALSVIERTREIGLLRAVGAHRSQIAWMVEWEAMIVAVLGGILGSAIGIVLGVALTRSLQEFQITELAIPWIAVVGLIIAAAISGFFAALYPAWRASRLDVLKAIATD